MAIEAADAEAAQAGPRRRSVLCASPKGLHRVAYLEWGDPRNRDVLVCVHGLTRSGRDFDDLARSLCGRFRVACPDLPGRGDSDKLPDPMLYGVPQYVADMVTLVARLDCEAVNWVGTSLGGLVGMVLAAQPGTPVKKLVLNDAGPVVSRAALQRIAAYVGAVPKFPTLEKAEEYVRSISAPFGPHSDAQWRTLTEHWVRELPEGGWQPHYDPRMAIAFRAALPEKGDLELWPFYDAIRCPTLVLRGEQSDLLTRETASAMARRGPKASVAEIAGVGHAPTLMHEDQIALVRDFLLQADAA
jgi:pimeloyl-ACP methyl ester carboxylesterase